MHSSRQHSTTWWSDQQLVGGGGGSEFSAEPSMECRDCSENRRMFVREQRETKKRLHVVVSR